MSPSAFLLLVAAHVMGAPLPPGGSWSAPPFTLWPEPPAPGDTLLCVIDAPLYSWPRRGTPLRGEAGAGDSVTVVGWATIAGVPWIATPAGWAEAARLDRPPIAAGEKLPEGLEGMAGGRTLPGGWRPRDLESVPDSLKAPGLEWRRMELRAGALGAFRALIAAAAADGIQLGIYSAFRSVEYQRGLYSRAVDRDPGQRSSAAPGRSEHHLGTTVDIATPAVPPLRAEIAESPAGRWIERRAREFGIVQSYSRERHVSRGVVYEPWHLRWVGERAGEEAGW